MAGFSNTQLAIPGAAAQREGCNFLPIPKARTPRAGTKQAKLIEMLRAEGGATIDEIVVATGWQPHTIRGAMSGALMQVGDPGVATLT